jgi:cob(I)alamin adenosyltransferase
VGERIYTRTGDQGETSLFGGGRVPKDHPRARAYGDVDELSSFIGLVRVTSPVELFDAELEEIQRDLFAIGGHLATPDPAKVAKALAKASLSPARVTAFERLMDEAEAELPPLRAFVLPGGTPKAAAFHVARTVCRRAGGAWSPCPEAEVPGLPRLPNGSQPALHPGAAGQPPAGASGHGPGDESAATVTHAQAFRSTSSPAAGLLGDQICPSASRRRDDRGRRSTPALPGRQSRAGELGRRDPHFPAGRILQDPRHLGPADRRPAAPGLRPGQRHHRARRRGGRRSRRVRRRHLPARRPLPPGSDLAPRHGGRVGGRKRGGHAGGEEPGRRLPPAGRGDRRSRHTRDPARARLPRGTGRGGEARADRGPGVLRVDGARGGGHPPAGGPRWC